MRTGLFIQVRLTDSDVWTIPIMQLLEDNVSPSRTNDIKHPKLRHAGGSWPWIARKGV